MLGQRPRRAARASAAAPGRRASRAAPSRVAAGQVRGALAPAVEHQHAQRRADGAASAAEAAWATWWGTNRTRAGSRPGSAVGEEPRRPLGVQRPQALPRVGRPMARRRARPAPGRRSRRPRRGPPGVSPASARHQPHRLLGQLPGRERHRRLAVLAPAEALLLGRRDDRAVHDERGGRVVEDRVDAEHSHAGDGFPEARSYDGRLLGEPVLRQHSDMPPSRFRVGAAADVRPSPPRAIRPIRGSRDRRRHRHARPARQPAGHARHASARCPSGRGSSWSTTRRATARAHAVRAAPREVDVSQLPRDRGAAARRGRGAAATPVRGVPRRRLLVGAGRARAGRPSLRPSAARARRRPRPRGGGASALDPACATMARSPLGRRDRPARCSGFVACAAVVRRSAFLAAGGFHPRYGIGGEEGRLAMALAAAGWQLRYVPDVVAHHHPATAGARAGRVAPHPAQRPVDGVVGAAPRSGCTRERPAHPTRGPAPRDGGRRPRAR